MFKRVRWAVSLLVVLAFSGVALAEGTTKTAELGAVHWSDDYQRWRDVATNPYASPMVNTQFYNDRQVWIDYHGTSATFAGTLYAIGLKPNFAYQLKLNGKPTRLVAASDVGWPEGQSDDEANERLGYAGRWYLKVVSRTDPYNVIYESGADFVPDSDYEHWKNQLTPFQDEDNWYFFEGYMLFDYIVTDADGGAIKGLSLDSSFHVLWKTSQRTPGENDSAPTYHDVIPSASPGWYGAAPPDPTYDIGIYAEWQPGRALPGYCALPEGNYNVRVFLTEESFHETEAGSGSWATVMTCDTVEFTVQREPAKHWAVICGVADYQSVDDLRYTDDDARDLAAALRQYPEWQGAGQIEVLIDSAASKQGVEDAIKRMRDKANVVTDDHDVCLFFFSGHGMQVVDGSGDEKDGADEALCAWDTYFAGNYVYNVITDDVLGEWLAGYLPADADVVTIIDTCFSGGMAKGAKGLGVKSVRNPLLRRDARVRRHFGRGLAKRLAARGAKGTDGGGAKDIGGAKSVVLMACEERRLSYETGVLQNGIFSYYVVDGITGGKADEPTSGNGNGLLSAEEDFAYAKPRTTSAARQLLRVKQVPQLYDGDTATEAIIVTIAPPPPVHDVAVVGIVAPSAVVQGAVVEIVVTVANEGNHAETFTLTLTKAPDGTPFEPRTVTLAPGALTEEVFQWNTTGATEAIHTLTAQAATVPGETDTADNTKSTTVTVNPQGSAVVRVASITMDLQRAGRNWKATALVEVVDQDGAPAGAATVAADWFLDGTPIGSSTGITDGAGQVTLVSPPKKATTDETFKIVITAVTKPGYDYDEGGSQTTAEITVQ